MVKRNIRQIIGVVMAAVFLATIAGSAGASAASGSISEAQKRKTQLENDLNDAQALIEQLQDQEGDIQEAVRELDDRLNVISGNIDTLKAQTRQKNKELLDTQNQLEAARTDESEQYESMKVAYDICIRTLVSVIWKLCWNPEVLRKCSSRWIICPP